MRILFINICCGGSTGRICTELADALDAMGHSVRIAYGRDEVPEAARKYAHQIGSQWGVYRHALRARLLDDAGFGSRRETEEFVRWVEEFDPDVIHLHNLHGYYLHVGVLFDYLRRCGKKIFWTLHDSWAYTGHTPYCDAVGCTRWIQGCAHCAQKNEYPCTLLDRSRRNWLKKRELFAQIPSMQLIVPSEWMARQVAQSFLKSYPVHIIRNGVDTACFRPRKEEKTAVSGGGSLKETLGLLGREVVLGVASVWNAEKGLPDFVRLAEMLPEHQKIVLIGLTRQQIARLPESILGIERTANMQELARYYAMADYFVNLTYQDTYPTTNLEAISCGTPVITYQTGGSPESALLYGTAVPRGDVAAVARLLRASTVFTPAPNLNLDKSATLEQYLKLYLPTQTGGA